jgi:hypothetical protein
MELEPLLFPRPFREPFQPRQPGRCLFALWLSSNALLSLSSAEVRVM